MTINLKQILDKIHGEGGKNVSKPTQPESGLGLRDLDRILVKIHSEYTRLKNADFTGNVRCFTCFTILPWKLAHEGHFISRRFKGLKFMDMNTNPQCPNCNVNKRGNLAIYELRLNMRYGKGTSAKLRRKSKENYQPTRNELLNQIDIYKKLVKIEKKRIGIK